MSESFYDALAPYYTLLYPDWEASCKAQAAALDRIIRVYIGDHVRSLLDAACGIGTQCLGLAQLGYVVTASDISAAALARARAMAAPCGLPITFRIADMRTLWPTHQQQFDVVLACDNAVPHLLSNAEILLACQQFYQCTAPGGGCILSVRDYTNMPRTGDRIYPRLTHLTPDGRVVVFDVWEFDGDTYDMSTYIVTDTGQPRAQAQVIRGGRYYCVTTATLEALLVQAGFRDVMTLPDHFFQPVLIGRKEQEE
jgi:SAM-dependent methyltransferase